MTMDLDWKRTALVMIDLQKGVVGRDVKPHSAADVVARSRRLADALRARGALVVFVRVSFSAEGKDRLSPACDQPMTGTLPAGWDEFTPELAPKDGDHVVTKKQWGAFYGTDLDLQLRRRGVRAIVLCGIATSIGVESTARDAYERGYEQVFVEDAMASLTAEEHAHTAARILPRIGRVVKTADLAG